MKKFFNAAQDSPAPSPDTSPSAPAAEEPSEVLVYTTAGTQRFPTWAQWKYLPQLLGVQERWLLRGGIIALVIGVLTFLTRGYLHMTEVAPQTGGTYTEGLVGIPQHINPLLSSLSDVDADLTSIIYSGLFRYNERQELVPDIITNYAQSEDQLTYTFFLNSNVYWHDGEHLDVDDVLFTIGAIQDPSYKSPLYLSLKGVPVRKIDELSFSLTLSEPFAPFLSTLTFGILPEHLWYDVPPQNLALTELNIRPVGTGPYKFLSLVKDKAGNIKSLNLGRYDDYHGQKAYIDELRFLFFPDMPSAIEALDTRKIEGLSFIPEDEKAKIAKQNSELVFLTLRIPQYTAIFFNQGKSEVLKDDTVRKALQYGVDRDALIREVLGGEGEAIATPILPGYVGHNPEVEKVSFNVEEGARLLEEAGWKSPATSDAPAPESEDLTFVPREKDGVQLEFTIATVNRPEYHKTLELLQKNWQAMGVKVNVDLYSAEDIRSTVVKPRDYEALLFGQIVGTDPDPFPFWHSSQQEHPGLGLAIFRDREIDVLLEEARATNNSDERRLKYLHFQNNIARDNPAIFLYNPLYIYGVHQKMHNVQSQYISLPSDRFAGVTNWYIKTKRQWR